MSYIFFSQNGGLGGEFPRAIGMASTQSASNNGLLPAGMSAMPNAPANGASSAKNLPSDLSIAKPLLERSDRVQRPRTASNAVSGRLVSAQNNRSGRPDAKFENPPTLGTLVPRGNPVVIQAPKMLSMPIKEVVESGGPSLSLPQLVGDYMQLAQTHLDKTSAIKRYFVENNYSVRLSGDGLEVKVGQNLPRGILFGGTVTGATEDSTTCTCTYPTGVVEIMSYRSNDDNSVSVMLVDDNWQEPLAEFLYTKTPDGLSWVINVPPGRYEFNSPFGSMPITVPPGLEPVIIPSDATPHDFMFAAWVTNFVFRSSIIKTYTSIERVARETTGKYSKQSLVTSGPSPIAPPDSPPVPPDPGCPPGSSGTTDPPPDLGGCSGTECCIPHDLVCTFPTIPFFVGIGTGGLQPGSGGKLLWFRSFPCNLSIEVDISECCFHHDINMWCSNNTLDLLAANSKVASCIADKLGNAIRAETTTGLFSNICLGIIQALSFLTWPRVYLYVFLALFPLTVGASSRDLVNSIIASLDPNFSVPSYLDTIGYGGINSTSCLCGGNQPTYQCKGDAQTGNPAASRCRDLCVETNNTDGENCFPCSWQCHHDDATGKYTYTSLVTDKSERHLPCCPGSACSTDFDPNIRCQPYEDAVKKCDCNMCLGYCCNFFSGVPLHSSAPPPTVGGATTLGIGGGSYWAWVSLDGPNPNCCPGSATDAELGPCNANTPPFCPPGFA